MEKDLTNEEIEVLRLYKTFSKNVINMMLTSDAEVDIKQFAENEKDENMYSKMNVIKNIQALKNVYSIILKMYYKKIDKKDWSFSKYTSLEEVNKIKNEVYIDKFIFATAHKEKIELMESDKYDMPAVINIIGDRNIPYIELENVLGNSNVEEEIIISPFTKLKKFEEKGQKELANGKILRIYNLYLEKQELVKMNEIEKTGLYTYLVTNADLINEKIKKCVELEKTNKNNYENLRKLEQLVSKYGDELEKKEQLGISEKEKTEELENIDRVNMELDNLKENATTVFQKRKSESEFITNWKKSLAVYLMSECKEMEEQYQVKEKVLNEISNSKMEKLEEEIKKKQEEKDEKNLEEITNMVKEECEENLIAVQNIIEEIEILISKQQSYAKIAGNLGTTYSALNNCFEMKKIAEELKEKIIAIQEKVNEVCEKVDRIILDQKLLEISKINIQISTLMNYLNNPKTLIGKSRITRFDEMAIIEENELKRGIAQTILNIRGEAELKKLKDDIEIIEEKSAIKRIIGMFTGRNKIDEYMLEQIEVRQNAIRKTLSKKLELSKNYSIHELVAEIEMFRNDNEDDELVEDDVADLIALEQELKKNFVISDSKVQEIIEKKEAKNLPIDLKKVTKQELIEIETYRFLNKYGYDLPEEESEPVYQDTMTNEINRIIEYVDTSAILD